MRSAASILRNCQGFTSWWFLAFQGYAPEHDRAPRSFKLARSRWLKHAFWSLPWGWPLGRTDQ